MANIDIDVAGRRYNVACRDGEEEQLRSLAAIVDQRAHDAGAALGSLTEARQLLFAALLLADQIVDGREVELPATTDPAVVERTERLAERLESLADALERSGIDA